MKPAPRPDSGRGRIFAVPAVIAALTLFGLVAGLAGEGAADLASWIALGACLAVLGWATAKRY